MILKQTGKLAPADQPWKLIRDAIHDLTLQENTRGVVIDMDRWHYAPPDRRACHQCLAGAVMSRRLKAELYYSTAPARFGPSVADRLYALNAFRSGQIAIAYRILGLTHPSRLYLDIAVTHYGDDPAQFKKDMLNLADMLESISKETDKQE